MLRHRLYRASALAIAATLGAATSAMAGGRLRTVEPDDTVGSHCCP
jgi:hypothetical protein